MKTRPISITGKLSPFRAAINEITPNGIEEKVDQPVLLELPSHPGHRWVIVFSEEEALHGAMKTCGITDYKIKLIQDGSEFLASIFDSGTGFRVMLDPRVVEIDGEKRTRWTEVVFGE